MFGFLKNIFGAFSKDLAIDLGTDGQKLCIHPNHVAIVDTQGEHVRQVQAVVHHYLGQVPRQVGRRGLPIDDLPMDDLPVDDLPMDGLDESALEGELFGQDDLLAIMSSGAYGFSMSSNYNSRPRAAEVLVSDERFQVIRYREEYEDLLRGESLSVLD